MAMTVTTVAVATATGISEAKAVNAAGQVVGSQDTTQAFLWTPNTPNGTSGTTATLPSLFIGGSAIAFALDNNGNVVGSSTDPTKTLTRATFWPAGGGFPVDLGTMAMVGGLPVGNSVAYGINDSGRIVGEADNMQNLRRAFMIDFNLPMRDLGTLVGSGTSRAFAVNNAGEIVGESDATDAAGQSVVRAFLFPAGALNMDDLLALMPNPFGGFFGGSSALAIDDQGEIVGSAEVGVPGVGQPTPVLFQRGGLPPQPFFPSIGTMTGSDGAGMAVGNNGISTTSAFLFDRPSFNLIDLSTNVGQPILSATGINAMGQISANIDNGGQTIAVLLTP